MVKNQGTQHRGQRTPGDCWQWKTNGQCSKGDNCSFRHDINKRAIMTQQNPSPSSFMRQNERNASRTRSPRGKSPSGRLLEGPARITSKELAMTHFVKSGTSPRMDADLGESALMRIARLMNSPAKGPKRMVTKVQWLC